MSKYSTQRKAKESAVSAILAHDNATFIESLNSFIGFDLSSANSKGNLRNIFENACAYFNTFAIDRMISDKIVREILEETNSYQNGVFIAAYNGNINVVERLMPLAINSLKDDKTSNIFMKEVIEASITGNEPKVLMLLTDSLNETESLDREDEIKLITQSLNDDKPHLAQILIEKFKITSLSKKDLPVKFFNTILSKENTKFLDSIIKKGILNLEEQLDISNIENSTYSKLALDFKLKNEMPVNNLSKPTKLKI